MQARKLVAVAVAAAALVTLVAQGAWSKSGGLSTQQMADLYQISQIEATWHRSTSRKNLDMMMSLWAPGGTITAGGQTLTGKTAIRSFFAKAGPFQTENDWVSETPAYKMRATLHGSKATFYFECHYVDVPTAKLVAVVGVDANLQKIGGRWLITNMTAGSPTLKR